MANGLGGIPIPVPPGGPANYSPIHEDDIIATLPKLLVVASIPATTLNWCGHQTVSLQEWCGYLGSLVGREPIFEQSYQALRGNPADTARMRELVGETTVDWRDGLRRMRGQVPPGVGRQQRLRRSVRSWCPKVAGSAARSAGATIDAVAAVAAEADD